MASMIRVLILLLLVGASVAQGQDFKRIYKNARTLFDEKQYNLAMEEFKKVIVYDRNNPYSEYASFYYAVCAYESRYPAVAKDMFIQMRGLHKQWDQLPEANYWLARIYFDQREFFQAMHILSEMNALSQDAQMLTDISNMKQHYLAQITDIETLRMACEEYPEDTDVAKALARGLARELYNPPMLRQFDSLVAKYNFNRDDFEMDLGPVSVKKDTYVVSLLFPFLASTLTPSPNANRQNQSVLELYQGMRMAADTLDGQGIRLDIRSYDTERNLEKLQTLLRSDELKNSDLIVGPLFPEEVKLVQQFSIENEIMMINPVSNYADYFRDNPFAALYQSSHQTIGERSAEILASAVRNKNCIVYFGETPKDSITAFSFMKKATELGINIVLAEEHRRETSGEIIKILTTVTEYDEFKNPKQFSLKLDSIGSIFVASDNALIYSKVNSSVTQRGDSIIVIGNESWIATDNTSVNFENYERMHVLLASSKFASSRNPLFANFRRQFMHQHGVYPSSYATLGYEFTLFIGHNLKEYGNYFIGGLGARGFSKAWLYEGYDFTNSRDNQYVPFVYFRDGELTVFNKK